MDELNHKRETLIEYLSGIQCKLLDRCSTEIKVTKCGSVIFSAWNDRDIATFEFEYFLNEEEVSLQLHQLKRNLGL